MKIWSLKDLMFKNLNIWTNHPTWINKEVFLINYNQVDQITNTKTCKILVVNSIQYQSIMVACLIWEIPYNPNFKTRNKFNNKGQDNQGLTNGRKDSKAMIRCNNQVWEIVRCNNQVWVVWETLVKISMTNNNSKVLVILAKISMDNSNNKV